jgi:hypothetical protein
MWTIFGVILSSMLLSLRSMSQLGSNTVEPQLVTTPAPVKTYKSLLILDKNSLDELLSMLIGIIKNNRGEHIAIEKIYLQADMPEIICILPSDVTHLFLESGKAVEIDKLWDDSYSESYMVIEDPDPQIIIEQYIISDKHEEVLFLSERFIKPKPSHYLPGGIDQLKWQQFQAKAHHATPGLTTKQHLLQKLHRHRTDMTINDPKSLRRIGHHSLSSSSSNSPKSPSKSLVSADGLT